MRAELKHLPASLTYTLQLKQYIMTSKTNLKNRLLPALVLVLAVMQLIDPSKIWTILLVGLGGLWLVSYIMARSLAANLKLVREMRFGWIQVGDVLEERFTLQNKGWIPATWVEIEDRSTMPGYDASLATGVDQSSSARWRKNGICARRGLYLLGDTLLHTGDLFGIYAVTIKDPARTSLLVMPPVVPLPTLEIFPGGYSGEGRPTPHAPENTLDASSVRQYVSGDSMNLIHWKTTARLEKPYVRLFDGAPASDWWILLDLQDAAQIGSEEDSTEEHGIILAASLADRGLRAHHGVGLVANGQALDRLPPRTGIGQEWEILRALALASPGTTSLGEVLEHIRPNLGYNATLIVITPTVQLDWLTTVPLLRRRGITPTVLSLDPQTFGGQVGNKPLLTALDKMGVAHHSIPRDLLDRPEARPGTHGKREFRISPTGRAIPVRALEDYSWRRLSE